MSRAEVVFADVLPDFLDWLPLTAALCLVAVAHIDRVPFPVLLDYVRRQRAHCWEKLMPILEQGFNVPCLNFRHRPVLLWAPDHDGPLSHDAVAAMAESALGVAPDPPGAFEHFMLQDTGVCVCVCN